MSRHLEFRNKAYTSGAWLGFLHEWYSVAPFKLEISFLTLCNNAFAMSSLQDVGSQHICVFSASESGVVLANICSKARDLVFDAVSLASKRAGDPEADERVLGGYLEAGIGYAENDSMVDSKVESRVMGIVDHASSACEPVSFTGESIERERR